jgi:hypothetical protein
VPEEAIDLEELARVRMFLRAGFMFDYTWFIDGRR